MTITFSKYHGAGNDFVLVDNRSGLFDNLSVDPVATVCHRRYGVGADGLILVGASAAADFTMTYYNADGKIGSMCGNGARCAVRFAQQVGITFKDFAFDAFDGVHRFELLDGGNVRVSMRDVLEIERSSNWLFMNTGSPHVVVPVYDLADIDVPGDGRKIRNSARFVKEGVNVNFVEPIDGLVNIRTYERGVEDETLACGTGCVAAALWAAVENDVKPGSHTVKLKAKGGNLSVSFVRTDRGFTDVWLEGPVAHVFDGSIAL
jgi:diaminopimelate epimerase